MENAVLFVVLAPFDNEQSDLINRVHLEADEVDTAIYRYRAKKLCLSFVLIVTAGSVYSR